MLKKMKKTNQTKQKEKLQDRLLSECDMSGAASRDVWKTRRK